MAEFVRSVARRTCVVAALAVLVAGIACTNAPIPNGGRVVVSDTLAEQPPDEPEPQASPSAVAPADASDLDALTVAAELSRSGYGRKRFKHWSDLDGDGCNTRQEVLIEESLVVLTLGPRCALVGGSWFSPYDGTFTTNPSTFDVDHFVPLAEAWDSGAKAWSDTERERYANDMEHADTLIAVTGSSNRSKADRDPAEWLPPREEFRCAYAQTWIDVKVAWRLTVDAAEMAALEAVLADCSG